MLSVLISYVKSPKIMLVSQHVDSGVELKSCKSSGSFLYGMGYR